LSNARRSPTGFGNQTDLFVPELKRAGHDVAVFAFYGQEAAPMQDGDGIITLPRLGDPYGNDVVEAYYKWWKADAVITLINPFVLNPQAYARMNWLAWTPVEGEPVQPGDVTALKFAKRIWAMTRHGEKQIRAAGFENVDYVPHGVDCQVFKPIDRQEARARLGGLLEKELSDRFIVAYNAANKGVPSRKGFYECMAAFAQFKRRYGQKAVLYLHSERDGRMGEPLEWVRELAELTVDDVIYAPQHAYLTGMLSPNFLNDVYNAADVYLCSSHGEGFGIPIVEAQAAGCPVVLNDWGAMSELLFEGRGAAPAGMYMHAPGMLLSLPSIDNLADALLKVAQDATHGREYQSGFARSGASAYDYWRVARDFMLPAIERFALTGLLPKGADRLEAQVEPGD
jgi:glycosyltransferase involved in cell wall biosynthesis